MKILSMVLIASLLAGCAAKPVATDDAVIKGFGAVKLGQNLTEARAALEHDHLYYSYTGRSLEYQTQVNGEHWFVSVLLIKTRVANITISARPQMVGMPLVVLPGDECNNRFVQAEAALKQEYGNSNTNTQTEGTGSQDMVWLDKDRSITLRRHTVDNGCDILSIIYDDHSVPDHF